MIKTLVVPDQIKIKPYLYLVSVRHTAIMRILSLQQFLLLFSSDLNFIILCYSPLSFDPIDFKPWHNDLCVLMLML